MKKQLLRTMLLLFALVAGSSSVWGAEKSYTITFKETGTSSDASAKKTTIEDIISDGASYVKSITSPTNVYQARTGRGIKLGTSKASGSLTLELAEAVYPTKITFHAMKYNDSETSITVNGEAVTDLTGEVTEYTKDYDGSTEVTSIAISTPAKRAYITQVTVYYEGSGSDPDPVAVTGVTVDPTEWEMTVGDTKVLTATVAPNNATDKTVSWSSDDESVATVSNAGVVTAVAAGTATITVTTTDGSKTATCEITVNPAPAVALTLDFSSNILGLGEGSSNKATASAGFTYGGYTYTLAAADGYYYNTGGGGYVMLGKSGSTFTFPAFPFNVSKIKIYGTSGASGDVKQNIYVGETAVSTETTGAKDVVNTYEIAAENQTAGNVYVLKVTSKHNTQISKIEIFGYAPITISDAEYATFAAPANLDFSETGITAYTAKANTSSVALTEVTQVPAGAAVVLYKAGADGTAINVPVIATADALENNDLVAGPVTGDGESYYVLGKEGEKVGFGLLAAGYGLDSNKAYIAASKFGAGAPAFMPFDFGGTTDISEKVIVKSEKFLSEESVARNATAPVYNLAGQRVMNPSKGLFIMNGKKVAIK